MRAVMLVCGLGCAALALSLLLGAGVPEHDAQAALDARRAVQEVARDLSEGVTPGATAAVVAGLEAAAVTITSAQETLVLLQQRRAGMGVAVGMVAALNLLLWVTMPASAEEARKRG